MFFVQFSSFSRAVPSVTVISAGDSRTVFEGEAAMVTYYYLVSSAHSELEPSELAPAYKKR